MCSLYSNMLAAVIPQLQQVRRHFHFAVCKKSYKYQCIQDVLVALVGRNYLIFLFILLTVMDAFLNDCLCGQWLMLNALDSRLGSPGSSPGRGHCVVFSGKTLYSHSASLHPRE